MRIIFVVEENNYHTYINKEITIIIIIIITIRTKSTIEGGRKKKEKKKRKKRERGRGTADYEKIPILIQEHLILIAGMYRHQLSTSNGFAVSIITPQFHLWQNLFIAFGSSYLSVCTRLGSPSLPEYPLRWKARIMFSLRYLSCVAQTLCEGAGFVYSGIWLLTPAFKDASLRPIFSMVRT